MKIFTQSVYILCRNREKICAAASEHIFLCFSKCVAAPRCISMFLKERVAASGKILTTASERKCAADIFFVCGCF